MTKEDFIEFIKDLGFTQTWQTESNRFSMNTDIGSTNIMSYADQLIIHIDDSHNLFQLSLSQMALLGRLPAISKNFGNFSLETFGDENDLQLEIFLSFILGSFNTKPKKIIQYMRDKKIKNILQ